MGLRCWQSYPLLLCVISSNVNARRKEMMAQDPESNSFDSTNPRLKGLQRVLRPTERRSQGHPGALQSREESWSPRSVFRGKAMCLPQLSLTIMGVHNPDCHDYSLESPALSGWNLSLCSAGTVTPSQLGVLPSGRRGRAAHLNQTGPREPLSPSIREERGGGNSEAPQCLPAHWTDRTSYSSQALTSEPKGGGAWEPGQPQQIQ